MYRHAGSTLGTEIDTHDDLHDGEVKTNPMPLAAGTYLRGQVLEMNAATGVLSALTTAANAAAVVAFDTTLTATTDQAVYVWGGFNQDAVDIGAADLAAVKAALLPKGIRLRVWGAAPDRA